MADDLTVGSLRTDITLDSRKFDVEIKNAAAGFAKLEKGADSAADAIDGLTKAQREAVTANLKALASVDKTTKSIGGMREALNQADLTLAFWLDSLSRLTRSAVSSFTGVEDALTDIIKVLDQFGEYSIDSEPVQAFGKEITNLALKLPVTQVELLQTARALAQLGLFAKSSSETLTSDVVDAVTAVSKASVALGLNTTETARSFGELRAIFGDSSKPIAEQSDQIKRLFDAMNSLDAATAATVPFMLDFLTRVGASGKNIGLSAQQISSFGVALAEAGQSSEVSGTALQSFFTRAITKSEVFAAAIGQTQAAFEQEFSVRPYEKLLEFLNSLNKVAPDLRAQIIAQVTDSERATTAIGNLANGIGRVSDGLGIATKAYNEGVSVQEEYARAAETTSAAFTLLGNTVRSSIIDGFSRLNTILEPTVRGLTALIQAAPVVSSAVATVGVVFAAGATALVGIALVVPRVVEGFKLVKSVWTNAVSGLTTQSEQATKSLGELLKATKALALTRFQEKIRPDTNVRAKDEEGNLKKIRSDAAEARIVFAQIAADAAETADTVGEESKRTSAAVVRELNTMRDAAKETGAAIGTSLTAGVTAPREAVAAPKKQLTLSAAPKSPSDPSLVKSGIDDDAIATQLAKEIESARKKLADEVSKQPTGVNSQRTAESVIRQVLPFDVNTFPAELADSVNVTFPQVSVAAEAAFREQLKKTVSELKSAYVKAYGEMDADIRKTFADSPGITPEAINTMVDLENEKLLDVLKTKVADSFAKLNNERISVKATPTLAVDIDLNSDVDPYATALDTVEALSAAADDASEQVAITRAAFDRLNEEYGALVRQNAVGIAQGAPETALDAMDAKLAEMDAAATAFESALEKSRTAKAAAANATDAARNARFENFSEFTRPTNEPPADTAAIAASTAAYQKQLALQADAAAASEKLVAIDTQRNKLAQELIDLNTRASALTQERTAAEQALNDALGAEAAAVKPARELERADGDLTRALERERALNAEITAIKGEAAARLQEEVAQEKQVNALLKERAKLNKEIAAANAAKEKARVEFNLSPVGDERSAKTFANENKRADDKIAAANTKLLDVEEKIAIAKELSKDRTAANAAATEKLNALAAKQLSLADSTAAAQKRVAEASAAIPPPAPISSKDAALQIDAVTAEQARVAAEINAREAERVELIGRAVALEKELIATRDAALAAPPPVAVEPAVTVPTANRSPELAAQLDMYNQAKAALADAASEEGRFLDLVLTRLDAQEDILNLSEEEAKLRQQIVDMEGLVFGAGDEAKMMEQRAFVERTLLAVQEKRLAAVNQEEVATSKINGMLAENAELAKVGTKFAVDPGFNQADALAARNAEIAAIEKIAQAERANLKTQENLLKLQRQSLAVEVEKKGVIEGSKKALAVSVTESAINESRKIIEDLEKSQEILARGIVDSFDPIKGAINELRSEALDVAATARAGGNRGIINAGALDQRDILPGNDAALALAAKVEKDKLAIQREQLAIKEKEKRVQAEITESILRENRQNRKAAFNPADPKANLNRGPDIQASAANVAQVEKEFAAAEARTARINGNIRATAGLVSAVSASITLFGSSAISTLTGISTETISTISGIATAASGLLAFIGPKGLSGAIAVLKAQIAALAPAFAVAATAIAGLYIGVSAVAASIEAGVTAQLSKGLAEGVNTGAKDAIKAAEELSARLVEINKGWYSSYYNYMNGTNAALREQIDAYKRIGQMQNGIIANALKRLDIAEQTATTEQEATAIGFLKKAANNVAGNENLTTERRAQLTRGLAFDGGFESVSPALDALEGLDASQILAVANYWVSIGKNTEVAATIAKQYEELAASAASSTKSGAQAAELLARVQERINNAIKNRDSQEQSAISNAQQLVDKYKTQAELTRDQANAAFDLNAAITRRLGLVTADAGRLRMEVDNAKASGNAVEQEKATLALNAALTEQLRLEALLAKDTAALVAPKESEEERLKRENEVARSAVQQRLLDQQEAADRSFAESLKSAEDRNNELDRIDERRLDQVRKNASAEIAEIRRKAAIEIKLATAAGNISAAQELSQKAKLDTDLALAEVDAAESELATARRERQEEEKAAVDAIRLKYLEFTDALGRPIESDVVDSLRAIAEEYVNINNSVSDLALKQEAFDAVSVKAARTRLAQLEELRLAQKRLAEEAADEAKKVTERNLNENQSTRAARSAADADAQRNRGTAVGQAARRQRDALDVKLAADAARQQVEAAAKERIDAESKALAAAEQQKKDAALITDDATREAEIAAATKAEETAKKNRLDAARDEINQKEKIALEEADRIAKANRQTINKEGRDALAEEKRKIAEKAQFEREQLEKGVGAGDFAEEDAAGAKRVETERAVADAANDVKLATELLAPAQIVVLQNMNDQVTAMEKLRDAVREAAKEYEKLGPNLGGPGGGSLPPASGSTNTGGGQPTTSELATATGEISAELSAVSTKISLELNSLVTGITNLGTTVSSGLNTVNTALGTATDAIKTVNTKIDNTKNSLDALARSISSATAP